MSSRCLLVKRSLWLSCVFLAACGAPPPEPPASMAARVEAADHLAKNLGATAVACPVGEDHDGERPAQEQLADIFWAVEDGWLVGVSQYATGERRMGDALVRWRARRRGRGTDCEVAPVQTATVVVRPVLGDGSPAVVKDDAGRRGAVIGCGVKGMELQDDGTFSSEVVIREDGMCLLSSIWPHALVEGADTSKPLVGVASIMGLRPGEVREVELVVDGSPEQLADLVNQGGSPVDQIRGIWSLLTTGSRDERPWTSQQMAGWLSSPTLTEGASPEAAALITEAAEAYRQAAERSAERKHARHQAMEAAGDTPGQRSAARAKAAERSLSYAQQKAAWVAIRDGEASPEEKERARQAFEAHQEDYCAWMADPAHAAGVAVHRDCEQRVDRVTPTE